MRTVDVSEPLSPSPVSANPRSGGAASAFFRCTSTRRRPNQIRSQSNKLTRMSTPRRTTISCISNPSPVEATLVTNTRQQPHTPQIIVHQAASTEANRQVDSCQREDNEIKDPAHDRSLRE